MTAIKVKEWILEKAQNEARRYNIFIDTPERADDEFRTAVVDADGYVTVIVEETLAESDKAVKVRLASGSVVGNANGWMMWIPKSQIKAVAA